MVNQNNYYQLKYKLTTHSNGYSFPNYAEDKWFPFCMPWIHEEATSINQAYIKDRVVKNPYCSQCDYLGSCLSEHLRDVKSLTYSCNGFKHLLDWYNERI